MEHYREPENLGFLGLRVFEIERVYTEKPFSEVFGIDSEKSPDLLVFDIYEGIWVGEIKSSHNDFTYLEAMHQAKMYWNELRKNHIASTPFMILDDYRDVIQVRH